MLHFILQDIFPLECNDRCVTLLVQSVKSGLTDSMESIIYITQNHLLSCIVVIELYCKLVFVNCVVVPIVYLLISV